MGIEGEREVEGGGGRRREREEDKEEGVEESPCEEIQREIARSQTYQKLFRQPRQEG